MGYRVQVKSEQAPGQDVKAGERLLWRFRLVDDDAVVVAESAALWDAPDRARSAGEMAKRTREGAESDCH
jgi:hypothetical protein